MNENIISKNREALTAYELDDYEKARALFEENATKYPCLITLNNLSWYYFYEEGLLQKAKSAIETAIELKPHSAFPYIILGDISLKENHLNQAIQLYHKALKYSSTPITTRHNLGLSYYLTGDFTCATTYFSHASYMTGRHSNQMHSRYCLFICLWNQGSKKLLKLRLSQPAFYLEDESLLLAQLYFGLEEYSKSCDYFKLSFLEYRKEPEWIAQYVYSMTKLKKYNEANKVLAATINEAEQELLEHTNELLELSKTLPQTKENTDDIHYLKREITLLKQALETYHKMSKITEKPSLKLNLSISENWLKDCYLFGCEQHGNKILETDLE